MSAKISIAYGESFHLYTDDLDPAHVWLQLDQPLKFQADQHAVAVRLPLALWEYLRTIAVAETDLAAKTDVELRALAKERCEAAVQRYHEDCIFVKSLPRRHTFRLFHKHSRKDFRENLRDPAKAVRKLLQHLRVERAAQRRHLAEVAAHRRRNRGAARRRRGANPAS